jgi:hypothetical protein
VLDRQFQADAPNQKWVCSNIERFNNPIPKHSKLDFLSPVQFEEGLKG